ncbi:MAG TPA: helix-hairpin-helix domain-containing protein [Chitinophagaceae bacterium]|jgi:DNA polymerase (family 10)|nr:helix-hairpin-helix domain-containing protein [Chitinophagaceae bacterium]HMU59025.1 helix-hairpin-helix domain-containing protein [Chitinophagaceae bacterium]
MDNYTIAENFSLLSKLMDIHGDNSFKSKTYGAAAFNIEKLPMQLAGTSREKLFTIKGIGESTGKKVIELLETGKLEILNDYIGNTPPGVIEMLHIKGLGPKKINTIWKTMEIDSLGELLYACNENRLTRFKGFGEATQKKIQEGIEFYFSNLGNFLYAELEELFPQIDNYLKKLFSPGKVHVTGKYRRQELIIEELEFVVLEANEAIKPKFQTAQPPELTEETDNSIQYKLRNGLRLRLFTGGTNMAEELFRTTGNSGFLKAFSETYTSFDFSTSAAGEPDSPVFKHLNLPFIPPSLREDAAIIEMAKNNQLPVLIQPQDIRSIIHSHSNWSDGVNTIEEMAEECIRRKLEYLVISDHSKTAGYANGLKEDRIAEQHRQIDELNRKLSPFRIFKSIESDILGDGSLDYTNDILQTFDLVIASVHSNLGMTEEKANQRLLKAIENPYTRILGHMTGRLLLSRNGYPVNHKLIIEACAANNVVIEINAHPRRLDMDWGWIDYALNKNVLLSINPDAHALDGFDDVKWGVLAAQKGGLTKENNLSSFSLQQFTGWLNSK